MDLVRNVLGFAPGGAVVVHINGLPQRHLAAERVRAAPLRAAGALVNSARLAVRKGGPSLLQVCCAASGRGRAAVQATRPSLITAVYGRFRSSCRRHTFSGGAAADAQSSLRRLLACLTPPRWRLSLSCLTLLLPHTRARSQAHASNFLYARSALGDRFQYFCMLASNALLVRPGIIAAMQGRSGTRHHVHNASRPDAEPHTWAAKWRDDATLQLLRRQFGVAHLPVRKQFHEGAFYRREAFAPLAKVIHEGKVGAHGPAGMDDRRPRWKYPAEEIYPATLLQRAVAEGPGEPVPDTFIQMDWEHDLETSVAGLSACDARPAPCFGVKRVALDARDAVRVHVRTQRLELYLVSAARRRHAAQAAAAIAAAWPEDEW